MLLYFYGILFLLIDFFIYKNRKVSPFMFFFGIFLIMGFQDAIGTDYLGSKEIYEKIGSGGTGYREDEFGWRTINYLFSACGLPFSFFILIQAFVNTYIISTLTARYIKDRAFWLLTFALFFYTFDYMMFHMTGFRQSFAVELCVLCVILIDKEKWLLSFICLLVARSIHTTALIMLPVIPVVYMLKRSGWILKFFTSKYFSWIFIVLFLATYVSKEVFADYIQLLILQQDMGGYEHYIEEMSPDETVTLIALYNGVLMSLALYMMNKMEGIYKVLMLMTVISCISSVFFVGSGSLFRLTLYFSIYNVVTIPLIVQYFYKKNKFISFILIAFFMAYAIKTSLPYTFGQIGNNHFNNYRFIFQ